MTLLAFDRSTVRSVDPDGRLHVSVTNISKANICPYYGREVPGWQTLGLDANRIYKLLRHPDELAAAAPTFNNLPILDQHVAVDAWDPDSHRADIVIGSTGTDASFAPPFLQNSAVLWSRRAIDDVQAADRNPERGRRQWSCAYRYTPDMTPGNFEGLQYDGVMRNIIGNHVALVDEGRAGPDVMIGDCSMAMTRKALLLSGALIGLVRPRLAQDAKLDLEPLLKDITSDNLPQRAGSLAVKVVAAAQDHLATDQALDMEDVANVIAMVQGTTIAEDAEPSAPGITPPAQDMDPEPALDAEPEGETDEEKAKRLAKKDKAMDGAAVAKLIANAQTAAVATARAEAAAIRQAERDVFPHIGELAIAQDSAADVYRLALDARGIPTDGLETNALKAMVAMLPKPGETVAPKPHVAADRANAYTSFHERFPEAQAARA